MNALRKWLCISAFVYASAIVPRSTSASPLFELVGAHEAGFAGRATPASARTAYFNPALLLDVDTGISVGVLLLVTRLEVNVGAREDIAACEDGACDVPEINGAGPESFRHADGSVLEQPSLPTAWLEQGRRDGAGYAFAPRPRQGTPTGRDPHAYLALGLVQDPIPERLAYGVAALVPLADFMRTDVFYSDEREQFFSNSLHHELYGDRLTTAGLAYGASVRVIDGLTLGASLTMNIASAANAPVYVSNLGELDSLLITSEVDVAVSFAPHIGLSVAPVDRLRLTATAHSPQSTTIETSFSYLIATGIEQRASQTFEHGYVPWTFGLGAELRLGDPIDGEWLLAASSTYALWSDYRDRHAESPQDSYAWSDMLDASLALRCRVAHIEAFASGTFEPSPVPSQTGRSSYVDSDRIGVALGASYDFALLDWTATLGVDAQLHHLLPQRTRKRLGDAPELVRDEVPDDAEGGTPRGPIEGREGLQTNNPGFPSFQSQGVIVGAGARFSLAY